VTWASIAGLFMVVVPAGAVLRRRRLPFWVRTMLVLLALVAMLLALLRGMGLA
jgi:hypothetical protein